MNTDQSILYAARDAWLAAADFRKRRDRYKRFTYGDQWSDIVADENGKPIVEYDYIAKSGRKPLTNNVIRQIVKVVVGRYRHSCDEDSVYDTPYYDSSKAYIAENQLKELDCRMLEEFLISGCAVQRISCDPRPYFSGISVDNVDPRMFFVNAYKDPRGRDIELIGMIHDLSFPEIISRFAANNPERTAELSHIYSTSSVETQFAHDGSIGIAGNDDGDFFCSPSGRCRAIEVWTLDCRNNLVCHDRQNASAFMTANSSSNRRRIKKINAGRKAAGEPTMDARSSVDFVWHCRWFAPDGTLLASFDSPYAHRSHPFALKMYPLTDGEVHSFVEDVVDQQKCINRMIVLIDHMIGASAKGVLLFPNDQKPGNISWHEVSSQWAKSNGVIPIIGRKSIEMPQQIITSNPDAGAYQLLSLQMKLFDNISGVGDALAGRNVSASTGNALYESQLRNSTIALADLIESFAAFRNQRDQKALNI